MHIRMTRQAVAPGGGLVPAETILDLPEAEALALIEAGSAEPRDPPAEPAPDNGETGEETDEETGEGEA